MSPSRPATISIILCLLTVAACDPPPPVSDSPASGLAELDRDCQEIAGTPRIEQLSERIYVATGFDLANIIVLKSSEGLIVIDTGMSPKAAKAAREELRKKVDAPVRAIIYTHSHIDHVGGASVWVEEQTQIWATAPFRGQFLKQYGVFQAIESIRGHRQFGASVPLSALPCTAIGPRPDLLAARQETGVLMPTHTFTEQQTLKFGDLDIELVAAPGETIDQLFVWLPSERTLLPGDNYYHAFPNLYTIRGSSQRPVNKWIASLDKMRRKQPALMIPSHTHAIRGEQAVAAALIDFRDAIQWIYEGTVRAANEGLTPEEAVGRVVLPSHLASKPNLQQIYGQVDWSVKGIYTSNLGWFGGRASDLYVLPLPEASRRETEALGGVVKVLAKAQSLAKAEDDNDQKWALQLLRKLEHHPRLSEQQRVQIDTIRGNILRNIAKAVKNTNGKAYLLESAHQALTGSSDDITDRPKLDDRFLRQIPLEMIFSRLAARLQPETSMDIHQSIEFVFPDESRRVFLTIRRGVAEVAWENPFPSTPQPLATMTISSFDWRRLALKQVTAARLLATGRIKVAGEWLGFVRFMRRFDRS